MAEEQKIKELESLVSTLSSRVDRLSSKPVLLSHSDDPHNNLVFNRKTAIEYTTTEPTDTPAIEGTRRIYFDNTDYWFYTYVNGGWRKVKLLATGRELQMVVFDFAESWGTGNGKFYVHVGELIAGMNLTYIHAEAITAGTTNTSVIQVHNLTQTQDMLSTSLTIDSGETGSDTAANPAVIDTANDDVAENDVLRIDCDGVSSTPPKGLILTLGFETP